MLLVDYREGSKELIKPLQRMGLPAIEAELPFGDLAFTGRGEGGKPVEVGVEYKQLRECVAAMRTGRLQGHQLPGMRGGEKPLFDFAWLLIEGELHFNKRGQLLRRAGKRQFRPMPGFMTVGEFEKRLLTMHLCAGMVPVKTRTQSETLKWIEALYRTWTDEDLDKHKSHLGLYNAPSLIPISEERQALCKWPGVGPQVSKAAMEAFGSVERAAVATVHEWASLTTTDDSGKQRRFGDKAAERVKAFLKGRKG